MVKILKITILTILGIVIILAGFYYFLSKKTENTAITIPGILPTQKTSSFSLVNAPSESLKGEISTMSGQILWQSRVATEEAQISSPQLIQQGEKLETGKNSALVLKYDGIVKVTFSPETAIDIIQTLPSNLVFSQDSGSAEYKNLGSTSVVSVRALSLLVQNSGDISVSINPQRPIVTLVVKSGIATVAYNSLGFVSHEFTIPAGRTYTFNDHTRTGVLR